MSNIFSGKKGVEKDKVEEDFVGGGGFILDTDIYEAKIKAAYLGKAAKSDARSFNIILDINGKELRNQIWMTNRNGDVTYTDKKTKVEKNLPGFNQINGLCMLLCSKELGDMDVEEMTLKIYDFDAKKELPKAVDCFVELHDVMLNVAVQRQIVDKTKLNESSKKYEPTGEVKNINEIIKFFPENKLVTISEVAHFIGSLGGEFDEVMTDGDLQKAIDKMEDENGNYADKWLEVNKGQTYDKSIGSGANKTGEGKSFKKKEASSEESKAKTNGLFDED